MMSARSFTARLLLASLPAMLLMAACTARPSATTPAEPPEAAGAAPAEASPTPAASATEQVTASEPAPANSPTATLPATVSATPAPPSATAPPAGEPPTLTPTTAPSLNTVEPPTASPTVVPPDSTEAPGQVTYVIYSEQSIGAYVARIWVPANNPFPSMFSLGTIDRGSERLVQLANVAGFEPLPAADLTGEGQPDIGFSLRWGGSHCCWGTVLYNLGDTPQQVLWVGGETGVGKFRDLDNDGDWEFITRDRVTGIPCSQPSPMAVLAYSPGLGYAPASPQYPAVFEPEIMDYTAVAEQRAQQNGGMTQCDVSDLMLDYWYSGQSERGAAEFARLYTAADAAEVWAAIQAAAEGGRLYVAAQ